MRLIWLPITSRTTNSVTISAPINANIAPPGYYMIHVLAGSLVPSTARIIQIRRIGGDTTPPTVTITSPANNAILPVGNVTVSGTSQDNAGGSGIKNVVLHVDRGTGKTATGTTNWSIVVNIPNAGTHSLMARADDNAGNRKYSKEIFITVQ